ncbi:DUF3558 domain-containing protein [Streptomyces sp. NPDC006798]|uniref:DUF3558 domain-containing protein n=1 Tax=Streptomyces sp. NPDC006798 TaxID=3155462 RepID=UPI0033FD50D0
MRRRTYASGISGRLGRTVAAAAGLAALATACTGGEGTTTGAVSSKAGGGSVVPAAPGKYRTLLEPCGSLGDSTLKDLLPGLVELSDEALAKALRGKPLGTYDTDRRVGCSWNAKTPDSSRAVSLDFERVVSYDAAVSDDAQAQKVFEGKQTAAGVPLKVPGENGETATNGTNGTNGETGGTNATSGTNQAAGTPASTGTGPQTASPPASSSGPSAGSGSEDGGEGDGTGEEEPLDPRVLDDLGDAAFLNDVTSPRGTGANAQRRTVSVVFRTSNVIVTVVYVEQSGVAAEPPDGKELQDKAQSVARDLVRKFSE